MILTDNETKVDLLNNEAIAKTIIELLREKPERAVTIGVHGDWGAGKSSILEMIENGLASDKDVLCIKFNGWRFQGFEDAKIALIEGIVTGLIEKRPLLTQAGIAVKDRAARGWSRVHRVHRRPHGRSDRRGGRYLEGNFLRSLETRHEGELRQSDRRCAGSAETGRIEKCA
jgi:hypothetical protein